MMTLNIGIAGYGVVGRAITAAFRQKGFQCYINDIRDLSDKRDVIDKKALAKHCDVIFICVPTPAKADGSIDLGVVKETVDKLVFYANNHRLEKKPVLVLKSTVVPGTTEAFMKLYPNIHFVCNPEFLRQEHALKDALDPDRIVIGVSDNHSESILKQVYAGWPTTPKLVCSPTTAEIIKYLSNAFLVHKVAFACECKRICDLFDVNPEIVVNGITMDRRINKSHLNPVLGPIASDSPCLPKDLSALICVLKSLGYESDLLKMDYGKGVMKKN